MTALCGGGTSAPKAGWPALVDPTIGLIANLLGLKGGKWAISSLGFQLFNPLNLAAFCAGDPPALPTFTADESEAIVGLHFGPDFDSGVSKVTDWVEHIIWYEMCECTSGTLTTYVAPSVPSGTPIYQPPVPSAPTACKTVDAATVRVSGVESYFRPGLSYRGRNVTAFRVTVTLTTFSGTPPNIKIEWLHDYQAVTPLVNIATEPQTYTTNGTFTTILSAHAGADTLVPKVTGLGGTGSRDVNIQLEAFCDGAYPGGTLSPCCPPDEATQAVLDVVLKMVTLIQRQSAPFAYVYGDNHTGLTGDGELAVSGLLGVSIDVTALPSAVSSAVGTPQHLSGVGYVTLGTDDGWLRSRAIDADGTLELAPNGAGALTRIGYTLSPGVEIAVRELIREP